MSEKEIADENRNSFKRIKDKRMSRLPDCYEQLAYSITMIQSSGQPYKVDFYAAHETTLKTLQAESKKRAAKYRKWGCTKVKVHFI